MLVSQVVANTPADRSSPRLTKGDQLVQINGQDVSKSMYSYVVQLIHDARNTETGNFIIGRGDITFIDRENL